MYCTACGKQIIDTARFCNFCGTPVKFAAEPAPNTSVPSAPSEDVIRPENAVSAPSEDVIQPENAVSAPFEEIIQPENAISAPSEEVFQPENTTSAPIENVIQPEDAVSAPPDGSLVGTFSVPAPGQITANGEAAPTLPAEPAKPLPERKYTLGHIILCLCAAAIMAIVAGVFAGLYFSVV